MTDKILSPKQINILTKNGIKEPWNIPYQQAADMIGAIYEDKGWDTGTKPKEEFPTEKITPNGPVVPKTNGSKYDWEEKHCRGVALECSIASTKDKEAPSVQSIIDLAERFFNFIYKGE